MRVARKQPRATAALIDRGIEVGSAVAGWALAMAAGASAGVAVTAGACLFAGAVALNAGLTARRGASAGKAAMGLRVCDDAGSPLSLTVSVGRTLVVAAVTYATAGVGLLLLGWSMLGERHRRAWHDLALGTLVVEAEAPAAQNVDVSNERGAPVLNLTAQRAGGAGIDPAAPDQQRRDDLTAVRRSLAAASLWGLEQEDGAVIEVHATTLFGRDPHPPPASEVQHSIAVDDDLMSRNHLHFSPRGEGLSVTDRGSTNGTVLRRGQVVSNLAPHTETRLLAGDQVRAGEWAVTVVAIV